ncbi:MAG TPA: MoaD/ThiS family protein [Candidatus Limnocylindrales bacterium]|nr:MoaD/ThiS family protein [Candidatus Limnocylindrales bacterium]
MSEVRIPRSLAALFPGTPTRLSAEGRTVEELIAALDAQVPGLRNRVLDAGPSIRTHINVFVAGERATLATLVPPGATVHIIPAVSGGEDRFVPPGTPEARPDWTGGRPQPGARGGDRAVDDPRALQILSTEHWSLLSARSLVYNEAFARGGMFLALLSATLVALGLISTGTGFSDGFLLVALLVLALDLFVGIATLARIAAVSGEDIRYLQGMNRIRHAYFEIVPGLDRYFMTSGHDDVRSVLATYGPISSSRLRNLAHGLTTMPGMIAVICSGLVGVLSSIASFLVTHEAGTAAAIGALGFAVTFAIETAIQIRTVLAFQGSLRSVFPAPSPGTGPGDAPEAS